MPPGRLLRERWGRGYIFGTFFDWEGIGIFFCCWWISSTDGLLREKI
jgi:hypothetical protein